MLQLSEHNHISHLYPSPNLLVSGDSFEELTGLTGVSSYLYFTRNLVKVPNDQKTDATTLGCPPCQDASYHQDFTHLHLRLFLGRGPTQLLLCYMFSLHLYICTTVRLQ